jgi:hypothetical protein
MTETMTKPKLLNELRSSRAEWEGLLQEVGEARMTQSGASGDWSVKDIVAHLTSFVRWYANAAEAALNNAPPPFDGTERMSFEERNQFFYKQDKDKPLSVVLAEANEHYQRLLNVVERHTEGFLTQPQHFPGAPEPVTIWQMFRGDIYDHSREHARAIRAWLDSKEDH